MTKSTGRWAKLSARYQQHGTRGISYMAARWLYWNAQLWRLGPIRSLRTAYKQRRADKKFGIRNPILVYQMGKVGSKSVYDSLQAYDLDVPIEHVHALNYLDDYEANIRATVADPTGGLRVIRRGRAVRRAMDARKWQRWDVISLVRMPIPRAISDFFYSLEYSFPDFHARLARNDIQVGELTSHFIDKYQDLAPLSFFNQQIRDLFGLDVYATPFARERGYQIYEHGNIRLLVLRLEDLPHCITHAMREFLGIENFTLLRRNVGETRPYGKLYQEFMEQLRLPPSRVQAWHSTPYAQHFYTPEELTKSVARWT